MNVYSFYVQSKAIDMNVIQFIYFTYVFYNTTLYCTVYLHIVFSSPVFTVRVKSLKIIMYFPNSKPEVHNSISQIQFLRVSHSVATRSGGKIGSYNKMSPYLFSADLLVGGGCCFRSNLGRLAEKGLTISCQCFLVRLAYYSGGPVYQQYYFGSCFWFAL